MTVIRRLIQLVIECVVGTVLAALVLGAAMPLLSGRGWWPGAPWNGSLIIGTILALVALMTLRRGGSLRF